MTPFAFAIHVLVLLEHKFLRKAIVLIGVFIKMYLDLKQL